MTNHSFLFSEKHKISLFGILLLITTSLFSTAQSFSPTERNNGYAISENMTIFIFDTELYNVNPEKVVVTGEFRSWSQDMDQQKWLLSRSEKDQKIWVLEIENPDNSLIKPKSSFKFRINKGTWIEPHPNAKNSKGGNLIFMHDYNTASIKASIIDNNNIWLELKGVPNSLNPKDYKLTDWEGKEIEITTVLPNTSKNLLIHINHSFDKKRVHYLEIPKLGLKTVCSFDKWFKTLYSSKKLGANISDDKKSTTFRIFAPRVESIKLYLYHDDKGEAFEIQEMEMDIDGVWEYKSKRNLNGIYYDFTVHSPIEPGSHSFESTGTHISDPYARVNVEAYGRSRVVYNTIPASPLKNGIPKMEDLVAYEVHIQDFTDQLPVSESLKGTIPAMIKPGLKNKNDEKVGFDYLLDLGINTVHLMPVQEYLHFPDEAWKASFENDPDMIKQGINEENYQWGYRTTHCFAIENKYAAKGSDYGDEREQFRDLVQAFHDNEIAVIIDIVPNHTGENMDDNHLNLHFNALDKLYYYRTKNFKHIGAFGNEVKTENRPMVQKWLIDQCKHFIEEFGIDGFRIDLAGQIDKQTLLALRHALGDDIIIYGEPWIGSNDPDFEANPDWDWYKEDSPITFFQDDTRNAFKGSVFDVSSKFEHRGWPGGKFTERVNVTKGLSANFPTDITPLSGINYLDIHDNMALADQFATNDFDGRTGVDENRFKIAATLLFTSLGPIVMHGGTEMMRSKGSAPKKEVVKELITGQKLAFHGKVDTYNQRKANNFVWENLGKKIEDEDVYCNYSEMKEYWKGLIHFRNSEYGKHFRISEKPPMGYYRWILERDEKAMGYIVNNSILVLLNSADYNFTFYINELPSGSWKLIANNEDVNHVKGVAGKPENKTLYGGNLVIKVPPEGIRIWVKEK